MLTVLANQCKRFKRFRFHATKQKSLSPQIKILFCISYLNIPIVITIAEQSATSFLIATSNEHVYRFFATFYPQEHLLYFEKAKSIIAKNPYIFISNAIFNQRLKRRLKTLFRPYANCDVYFFLYAFAESAAYAVKHLARRNHIFHIPSTKGDSTTLRSFKLYSLLNILAKKIVFGLDVYAVNISKKEIFPYSGDYFRSLDCIKSDMVPDPNILREFQKNHLNIANKKILILAGMLPESGIVGEIHYSRVMDKLIQALPTGQVAIKLHPRANQKYSAENNLPELPKDWPANLLIYAFPVIIGYHSASIYEAANNGCVAISLLDLIDPKKPTLKNFYKSYLIKHLVTENTIHFPRTIEALLEEINHVI